MSDRGGSSGSGGRSTIGALLLVANLALAGLNLDKRGYLPVSTGLWEESSVEADGGAALDDAAADGTAGDDAAAEADDPADEDDAAAGDAASGDDGADPSGTAGDAEDAAPETTVIDEVDDWPGGRGPVPLSPPVPRVATIDEEGRLTLSGSAPNWATARLLAELAGTNLPGGFDAVNNQLTWHPDAPADIRSGDVVINSATTFDLNDASIEPGSAPILDLAADILSTRPSLFVVVIGHTDDVGDDEVNAQLALARANAVAEYLIAAGVVPAQIVIAAAGEDDPTASNETQAGRDANRRIELQFKNFFLPTADAGAGS